MYTSHPVKNTTLFIPLIFPNPLNYNVYIIYIVCNKPSHYCTYSYHCCQSGMLWWLLGTVLFVLVSANLHILVEVLLPVLFVLVTLQRHGITDYIVFINMASLSLCNMWLF